MDEFYQTTPNQQPQPSKLFEKRQFQCSGGINSSTKLSHPQIFASTYLQKFCELWLLIGRGDRTHPYLSPHPTSSHNSQYFRRTVLRGKLAYMTGRVRQAICRGEVWVHVAYFPGTPRDRGVPARYATITRRTRRVCVVIVAYPCGTPRDRGVPCGYATITRRTRRVCVVIVAYRRGTLRDRGIPGE